MTLRSSARRPRRLWAALIIAVAAVAAVAVGSAIATYPNPPITSIPGGFFTVTDAQGANDVPAQSDLTQMGRDDTNATVYSLFWSWDEIDQWTGTGQTGDACALFDNDGDGNINFVVCARVSNTNADPTVVQLVPQDATHPVFLFSCSDAKNDRCTQPNGPQAYTSPTQADAGVLGTLAKANLITETDPFGAVGSDTPRDSTIEVKILKSVLPSGPNGQAAVLTNVCSYPSAGNGGNNNPFDCVVSPGGGFLVIAKDAGLGVTTPTFGFTVANPAATRSINGTGSATGVAVLLSSNPSTSVTEGTATNWSLISIQCLFENGTTETGTPDLGNRKVTSVAVQSGKITTCTFTNRPVLPKLTVTKVVTNNNGGGKVVADFPLFVNTTSVTSGVQGTFAAGNYTVSETNQTGYTGVITGDCASDGSITLALGDVKACTITNTDNPPVLRLRKVVQNDNGGNNANTEWTLNADKVGTTSTPELTGTTPVDSSTTTFQTGTYALSETNGPAGYTPGTWSCVLTGTQTSVTVTNSQMVLGLGQDVTCTITNDDNAPSLSLKKVVTNDNGGNNHADEWTLIATGSGGFSGAGTLDGSTAADDAVNGPHDVTANVQYALSESGGPTGYTAGAAWSCTAGTFVGPNKITLAEGQSATCTITNDDNAPSLSLKKVVTNDNGGNNHADEWTLIATGSGGFSGAGTLDGSTAADDAVNGPHDVTANVQYALSESGGPTGYTAGAAWSCTAGTFVGPNKITLAEGQSATCTITNDDNAPSLSLKKVVTNDNGGNNHADEWTLIATGSGGFSGAGTLDGSTAADDAVNGPHDVTANVQYALSESGGPTGYTAGAAWSCTAGTFVGPNKITLAEGQSATCTITNDDNAPSLSLKKVVTNDNGGNNHADEWTLIATGSGGFSGAGTLDGSTAADDAVNGPHDVTANVQYALSESGGPTGYTAGAAWSCTAGTFVGPNKITLAEGQSATCTITNDDNPASPTGTTIQSWIIKDSISISGILAGAGNQGAARVTFRLYSNASCGTQVGTDQVETIDANGNAATTTGIAVTTTGLYYWRAQYSGDAFNNGFTTPCGDEITQIQAKDAFGGIRNDLHP